MPHYLHLITLKGSSSSAAGDACLPGTRSCTERVSLSLVQLDWVQFPLDFHISLPRAWSCHKVKYVLGRLPGVLCWWELNPKRRWPNSKRLIVCNYCAFILTWLLLHHRIDRSTTIKTPGGTPSTGPAFNDHRLAATSFIAGQSNLPLTERLDWTDPQTSQLLSSVQFGNKLNWREGPQWLPSSSFMMIMMMWWSQKNSPKIPPSKTALSKNKMRNKKKVSIN